MTERDGTTELRISVRVRPGASRTCVGGSYGDGDARALVVAVGAPAVDGRANEAVLRAVAEAFGLRPAQVALVRGAAARTKLLALRGDPADLGRRRDELLGSG